MMKPIRGLLLAALVSTCLSGVAQAQTKPPVATPTAKDAPIGGISMPAEEFTLPNGLRVIVHTDRSMPLVAVSVWYNVGAANETAGHTGFAHLFEHLMFQGSENFKGEFFQPFREVGATDQNGSTSYDWTNYYQTVPTPALDMALWMESDRMGHLVGAIDQKTLDEQRGVVQNEKRQRYGQPYGLVMDHVMQGLFPKEHPYYHMPIGSMADLDAASLEDVRNWFRSWYGPNNAVLTLAGDIDVATAREKATKYFGDIAPSATVKPSKPDLPVLAKSTREVFPDKVPQAAIYRAWVAPEGTNADNPALTMVSYILGVGETSRLNERLVRKEGVAVGASSNYNGMELAGTFMTTVTVKDGVDPSRVEAMVEEEIQRFIKDGPTQAEIERTRTVMLNMMAKRMPKLAIRSAFLNLCAMAGRPADCWREDIDAWLHATPEELRTVAARWLTRPSHTVEVQKSDVSAASKPESEEKIVREPVPVPPADTRFHATGKSVDRSAGPPKATSFPDFKFPAFSYATLSNGIKVKLVERHGAPLVMLMLNMPGGPTEDQTAGGKKGRVAMAMEMLGKGTTRLSPVDYARRQQELGVDISGGAGGNQHFIILDGMKATLPQSLDLMAEMMFHPLNDPGEMARYRDRKIVSIKRGKVDAQAMIGRISGRMIYGPDDIRGQLETEEAVNAITRDELIAYQQSAMRPDGATMLVIGDTTIGEIVPLLEARFGSWKPVGEVAEVRLPDRVNVTKPKIYLIDQPGALQSQISVGEGLPVLGNDMPSSAAAAANGALGGGFLSRLNLNLREDKHWAYGAGSSISSGRYESAWAAQAPVQTDKTADAMREMFGEFTRLDSGEKPVTEEEIERQKASLFGLPGSYDINSAILQTIVLNTMIRRMPDDYVNIAADRLRQVTPALAQQAFSERFDPNALVWFVVGDLSKIEAPIRALGIGDVIVVDTDGNPVAPKAAGDKQPSRGVRP